MDRWEIRERLEAKRYILEPEGCWLYTGCTDNVGYGQISVENKTCLVHRLALYAYTNFNLLSNSLVLHIPLCKRKNCFNPKHLYAGDQCDNMQDKIKAGTNREKTKTHCKQGHPFDSRNTYTTLEGFRKCKQCRNLRRRVK